MKLSNLLNSAILIGLSVCVLANKSKAAQLKTYSDGAQFICADQTWQIWNDKGPSSKKLFKGECMLIVDATNTHILVEGKTGKVGWLRTSQAEVNKLKIDTSKGNHCMEGYDYIQ